MRSLIPPGDTLPRYV
ncbi:MAG: hypothetical protein ACREVA_11870, partial [Burkholderiales bacterium]